MTGMEGDAMSHNQPNTAHSERLATRVNAHGDGIDTTPERVHETGKSEHIGEGQS